MPTVPEYGGAKVREAPIPGMRYSGEADPAAFGGAMAGPVEAAGKIFADIKARADRAAVMDAEAKLIAWSNSAMHDPKTGALTKRGKEAFGVHDAVGKDYEVARANLEKGLHGRAQIEAFRERSDAMKLDLDARLMRHVAAEGERFEIESAEEYNTALADRAEEQVGSDPFDPSGEIVMADSISKITANITELGAALGKPQTWVDNQVSQQANAVAVRVVGRLLKAGDYKGAADIATRYKHFFKAKDRDAIMAAVEVGNKRQIAMDKADDIRLSTTTLEDALAKVREIKDPELRDDVMARVRNDRALDEQARAEVERDLVRSAHDQMIEGVERQGAVLANDAVDYIDAQTWAALKPDMRESLRELSSKMARGEKIQTDWSRYYSLKEMAADPATTDEFLGLNLEEEFLRLDEVERKELISLQEGLRKDDAKVKRDLAFFKENDTLVNNTLLAAGIEPDNKSVRVGMFRKRVRDKALAYQARTGKAVDDVELQRIVDDLLMDAKGLPEVGDVKTPLGMATADEILDMTDSQLLEVMVPPDMHKQIVDSQTKLWGKVPTEADVARIYLMIRAGISGREIRRGE